MGVLGPRGVRVYWAHGACGGAERGREREGEVHVDLVGSRAAEGVQRTSGGAGSTGEGANTEVHVIRAISLSGPEDLAPWLSGSLRVFLIYSPQAGVRRLDLCGGAEFWFFLILALGNKTQSWLAWTVYQIGSFLVLQQEN